MFNDDGEKICGRYTVIYEGFLFEGDSDGLNFHDYDFWWDVQGLIYAYGDIITIKDNAYGLTWQNHEWY